jgi:hypothetical protein
MKASQSDLKQVHVILPKYNADAVLDKREDVPFVFLIGPVLGGGDWQLSMMEVLTKHVGVCIVAIPCRWDESHQQEYGYTIVGTPDKYPRQLAWEIYYRKKALTRKKSCKICWLGKESAERPRADGQPYSRDTQRELGELCGHYRYNRGLKFVIGGDPLFPGFDVHERCFTDVQQSSISSTGTVTIPPYTFYREMEETVKAALPFLL